MKNIIVSAYKYNIYNTFSDIVEKDWNAVPTSNIYLNINFLRSLENSVEEVKQFFYVIYYENKKPIGKSVFQLIPFEVSKYENFDTIPCKISNKIASKLLPSKLQILVCGNIFATGENAFVFNKNYSKESIFKQINTVTDDILSQNKKIKYVLFKEFSPNKSISKILENQYNFIPFNIDVNMVFNVDNNWKNLSSVLSDFRTKYRSRANNVLKKSKEIVVQEFDLDTIKKYDDKLAYLYNSVIKKSNFNIGVFNFETFYLLKKNLPLKYKIFGYFLNNQLIGFKTLFHSNGFVDASFIGLDYNYVETYKLYQRILLDYVEYAITNKSKILNLGRTAETIKCCVGAEPVNMDLYIKHKTFSGNALLKLIIQNINPSQFSIRNPFKNGKTLIPLSINDKKDKENSNKKNAFFPKLTICSESQ